MKKIIIFLVCVCFLTMPAMAAEPTCNGGSTFKANTKETYSNCSDETCNGKTFCKSDNEMNWWSAFTWCESQGRTLAEFSKMCPGVSQALANTTGDCPNLQGKGDNVWVWSSLAYGSSYAILVNLSSGAVYFGGRDSHYSHFALCE